MRTYSWMALKLNLYHAFLWVVMVECSCLSQLYHIISLILYTLSD